MTALQQAREAVNAEDRSYSSGEWRDIVRGLLGLIEPYKLPQNTPRQDGQPEEQQNRRGPF